MRVFFVVSLIVLLSACSDNKDNPVIYRFTDTQNIMLLKDSAETTFFNHDIILKELNFTRIIKIDTIRTPQDTIYKSDTTFSDNRIGIIVRNIKSNYSGTFTVLLHDSANAGISAPGKDYSNIRIICDSMDIKKKIAYIRVKNSTYMQDNTDWK